MLHWLLSATRRESQGSAPTHTSATPQPFETLEARVLLANVPSGFTDAEVAGGINSPTAMVVAPDGRVFVAQQAGGIRVIKDGNLLPDPFYTLDNVNSDSERGLLGIELDPDFANNGYIYVYYTVDEGPTHNRIARLTADGDVAAPGSQVNLVELPPIEGAIWHMGGALHFGPDGKLYTAVGDHLWFDANALQSLDIPFGKILRFNSDGSIPTDNPFYDQATGLNRATWAMGLRNPFTFAFQPGTGRMFINDVGQETWEEINEGVAGANYGWPASEGPDNVDGFTAPLYYYGHDQGLSITGGVFYNPDIQHFPAEYTGRYFFGDVAFGWIRWLDPANGNEVQEFATGLSAPVDLDLAPDGSLYYLQRGPSINSGSLNRISNDNATSGVPIITTQPQNRTVNVGVDTTFSVTATGDALSYQWQKNGQDISGATASTLTINGAQLDDQGAYRVRVSNFAGEVFSNEVSLTVVQGNAPTAKIVSPRPREKFHAGQTITLDGRGFDDEDGKLGPSKFTWQVDYHTGTVVRPFIAATTGSRVLDVTIPTDTPYKQTDVFYRVILTVRDSTGSETTVTRDIGPTTARVKLTTNIGRATLFLDEQPKTGPLAFEGVSGLVRNISAPPTVDVNGQSYVFDHWSDGGERQHDISTPLEDKTYVARYKPAYTVNQEHTLSPTSDSFVNGSDPGAINGSGNTLITKTHKHDEFKRDILLKFDLSEIVDTIQSAKLRVFGRLGSAINQNLDIGVYQAPGAKWDEASANWDNRPDVHPKGLTSFTVNDTDGQWYSIDLTDFFNEQRAKGRTIVTLVLRSMQPSQANALFDSKEAGDTGPQLKVIV